MRLYNKDKWLDIINDEKYEVMREKIRNSFKDLEFDEGPHKYYLHGRELECVSNITHLFKEHFDSENMAIATSERNFDNPNSKYYQMTPSMILEEWKKISSDACSHGTERHLFSECACYFMMGQYDKIADEFKDRLHIDENGDYYFEAIHPKEEAAAQFYLDMPKSFVPLMPETKVYILETEFAYSGTFDLLCYYDAELDGRPNEYSGLVVLDWKTNKDLYKNFAQKTLLHPFEYMLDMPLSLYKLQLAAYSMCLEKIGFKVVARRIMWLLPNGEYRKINIEYMVKHLRDALIELYYKTNKS